jgi:hypothetical protein
MPHSPFTLLYIKDQQLIRSWAKQYTDDEFYRKHASLRATLTKQLTHRQKLTGREAYCVALILHHSPFLRDNQTAQHYEQEARKKNYYAHPHLKAQLIDKALMLRHKKQWYGTQAVRQSNGKFKQWPVKKNKISDAQRKAVGLPSLKALRNHLEH